MCIYIYIYATAAAKSLQSCQTLCDPIDVSPPGSPIPGLSRQEHWSRLPYVNIYKPIIFTIILEVCLTE